MKKIEHLHLYCVGLNALFLAFFAVVFFFFPFRSLQIAPAFLKMAYIQCI